MQNQEFLRYLQHDAQFMREIGSSIVLIIYTN